MTSETPQKVKTAALLIYGSAILGVLEVVLMRFLTDQNPVGNAQGLVTVIITLAVIGFLGYSVGQGKNWARITLLVLFGLGMLVYPFDIWAKLHQHMVVGIAAIVQMLIQFYVLIILFTGEAKEWFALKKKEKTTANTNYENRA